MRENFHNVLPTYWSRIVAKLISRETCKYIFITSSKTSVIVGSQNGFSPVRQQAITQTIDNYNLFELNIWGYLIDKSHWIRLRIGNKPLPRPILTKTPYAGTKPKAAHNDIGLSWQQNWYKQQ